MENSVSKPFITVYTSKTCVYCHKVKDYLKGKGLEFTERGIDDPKYREELISLSGQLGVPVTNINGDIVVGFSKKRLDELC